MRTHTWCVVVVCGDGIQVSSCSGCRVLITHPFYLSLCRRTDTHTLTLISIHASLSSISYSCLSPASFVISSFHFTSLSCHPCVSYLCLLFHLLSSCLSPPSSIRTSSPIIAIHHHFQLAASLNKFTFELKVNKKYKYKQKHSVSARKLQFKKVL